MALKVNTHRLDFRVLHPSTYAFSASIIHGAFIMSHAILYHSSPYFAHLSQTMKGLRPGDWGRFLVIAATREDMKRFFRGLQKYTKISNTTITEVTPVHLGWWNFKTAGQLDLLELIQKIYRMDTSYCGNIEELNESYGKIQVTRLTDGIGTKDWPILPLQDVPLRDLQMHD